MEAVKYDTLNALADSLAAEAKSLARRARLVNQQAAALRDHIHSLQTEEIKNGRSK